MSYPKIFTGARGTLCRPLLLALLGGLACAVTPLASVAQEVAAVAAAGGAQFGWYEMFMQAHIVVKVVIVFLALCSVLTWMIFIEKALTFSRARSANETFLANFRRHAKTGELPPADTASAMGRMWHAACAELGYFKTAKATDTEHHQDRLLQRLALQAGIVQEQELAKLGTMMGVLATVGSTSPFTGLFGTVWGIVNSFASIAVTHSTSLSVVAPGIAEALVATAIGLFAAIPAVIIYNKFVRDINGFVGSMDNFSAELLTVVSRRLDTAGVP